MSTELKLDALNLAGRVEHTTAESLVAGATLIYAWLTADGEPTAQTVNPLARQWAAPPADPAPASAQKRGRGRPRKETEETDEAETEAPLAAEPETVAEEPVAQPPRETTKPLKTSVTRDVIKLAIENAIKGGIRDDVKKILGKYSATNLSNLPEGKWSEFMADLDTALLNS